MPAERRIRGSAGTAEATESAQRMGEMSKFKGREGGAKCRANLILWKEAEGSSQRHFEHVKGK